MLKIMKSGVRAPDPGSPMSPLRPVMTDPERSEECVSLAFMPRECGT